MAHAERANADEANALVVNASEARAASVNEALADSRGRCSAFEEKVTITKGCLPSRGYNALVIVTDELL